MRKPETLRGYRSFKRVSVLGTRIDGDLLRCYFILEHREHAGFRVGYKVWRQDYKATQRNRIKRLMRQAFSSESHSLNGVLQRISCQVSLVLVFSGPKNTPAEKIKLLKVQKDVGMFCSTIAKSLW